MSAPDTTAIREFTDTLVADATDRELRLIATIHALCDALDEARAAIDNLHAVEKQHRATANEQFHRAERLRAENERLRAVITDAHTLSRDRRWPLVQSVLERAALSPAEGQNEGDA
jgi:hypothetical protein